MIRFKNVIILLSVGLIFSPALAFSGGMGKISKYEEIITPDKTDAVINVTIEGKTNDDGILYVPSYKKADLLEFHAIKGKLTSNKAAKKKVYGQKCMVYQFAEGNKPVILKQKLSAKDFYMPHKGKVKYSHPDKITSLSYSFNNTAPVKIGKYTLYLSIPEDVEIYEVISPKRSKKKKTFELLEKDGLKTLKTWKSKIKPYNKFKVKANLIKKTNAPKVMVWLAAICLSIFILVKRKDILAE